MKNTTKKLFNKVASLALAAMMVLSVFCVSAPTEVSAADKSFNSTGKSSVTITDQECYKIGQYAVTGEPTWVKFKAKNDGYLKISASMASTVYTDYVDGQWQLYDKKKTTAVAPVMYYDTNSTDSLYYSDYYGVKKGTTYYLKVYADGGVKLTASFTKVSDKSGSKKAKALNIKSGKTVTGLVRVGDSKVSDWYKINLSSAKKLTFSVTTYVNDVLNVTLSGPGVYTKTFKYGSAAQGKKAKIYTSGKVKAGTYYLQVKPATKTTSGYYKISWK